AERRAGPTPSPSPFTLARPALLYADGTISPAVAQAAPKLLGGVAGIASVTPAPSTSNADLVLTYGTPPAAYSGVVGGSSPATILTHLRVPVDGVTASQAQELLGGQINDWHAVRSPYSLGAHVFTLAGLPTPAGVTIASGARPFVGISKLLAALRSQPG